MSLIYGRPLCLIGTKGQDLMPFARKVAAANVPGPYFEIQATRLLGSFCPWEAGPNRPSVVIADSTPVHLLSTPKIKSMVTNYTFEVNRKGLPRVLDLTPLFIFCMQDGSNLELHPDERRYVALDVNAVDWDEL